MLFLPLQFILAGTVYVRQEISDKLLDRHKAVSHFSLPDMLVVTLAPLIVVNHQALVSAAVIEAVFQSMGSLRISWRQTPYTCIDCPTPAHGRERLLPATPEVRFGHNAGFPTRADCAPIVQTTSALSALHSTNLLRTWPHPSPVARPRSLPVNEWSCPVA